MYCFHNPKEKNGYLSNWYMSDFEYDGVKFCCSEQYMMYSKAVLFRDYNTAKKIMDTRDCRKIKQLGREVRNFDGAVWDKYKCDIMYRGLLEKFVQNKQLKELLLATGDDILAECAVHDKIWGIGLSMTDPKRTDQRFWRGQNLLGKTLMNVRATIRKENL